MIQNSKILGNEAFRLGKYHEAIKHYTVGLLELQDANDVDERYKCLNNRSQCYLKVKEFQKAFDDANQGENLSVLLNSLKNNIKTLN
jgi:hypothetical protein